MSTPVRFWLDPLCPFCWVTALWLRDVAPERDLEVSWQPISLRVKNELEPDSDWYGVATWSFNLLRVLESVRASEGEQAVGDLYVEFGRRIHHDGQTEWPVIEALVEVGLPASHAAAFDDESLDAEVLRRHHEALALVGNDVGTPIIGIPGRDGAEVAIFGPVINARPSHGDALALWDATVAVARIPEFFELKRSRTGGPNPGPRSVIAALHASTLITYPIVGVLAGLAIGLTGMGGGALLTPIMVLVLGVPANVAVSNDLVISLLVKPVGALTHRRAGTVRRDMVTWLAVGSVPAAFVGAVIVNTIFRGHLDSLKLLLGCTLVLAAVMMIVRMLRRQSHDGTPTVVRPVPTVAIGVLGGLLVGITSVGSGSLMLVLMAWAYPKLSSRELVGTDLAQAIPLVASAVLGHLLFGDVRLAIVAPVLIGALPGVWLGSRWSSRMPDRALRPILVTLVGISGLRLVGII